MQLGSSHVAPRFQKALLSAVGVLLLACLLAQLGGCARSKPSVETVRALMARGELSEACRMARRLADRDAPAARRLERLRCWIECLARGERLSEAEAWLARRPGDEVLSLYGRALLAVARSPDAWSRAVELFERAARRWPSAAEIPYRSGILLLANGRAAAAERHLARSCAIQRAARCMVARAHALLELGREVEALELVRFVPDLTPRPDDVKRGRALIKRLGRRRQQRVPAAQLRAYREAAREEGSLARVQRLRELVAAHPKLADAHTAMGIAHLELDRAEEAIEAFVQAEALAPLDARNPFYKAVAYRSRGRVEQAERAYRKSLELDPFLVPALAELVKLAEERGERGEAARLAERLVAIDLSPNGRRSAARASYAARKLDRALVHYRWLASREPDNFEAQLRLAEILLKLRDSTAAHARTREAEARAHLERAAALRPGSPDVKRLTKAIER